MRVPCVILALAVLVPACQGSSKSATSQDSIGAVGGDASTAKIDATADAKAFALEPDPVDLHAMTLLLQARAASAKASTSIWPSYTLGQVPTYLVRVDAKMDAVRGWLLGHATPPKGAFPLQAAQVAGQVLRYDADLGLLKGEDWLEDLPIAATSTLVLTYDENRLNDPQAWVAMVGEAEMERVRRVEAKWSVVAGCGQIQFPRVPEAIALLFVDAALLKDAYAEKDHKKAEQLLREWYAVREQAQSVAPTLPKRNRHYDNQYGSNVYTSHRLLVATGLTTEAQLDALYAQKLSEPFTVPIKEFDDTMLANGWLGAAALSVAIRLGWEVEPFYRKTDSVYWALPGILGEPPPSLVEVAKKRYDWAAFQARAEQVMTIKVK
jgi:hypothetical protein